MRKIINLLLISIFVLCMCIVSGCGSSQDKRVGTYGMKVTQNNIMGQKMVNYIVMDLSKGKEEGTYNLKTTIEYYDTVDIGKTVKMNWVSIEPPKGSRVPASCVLKVNSNDPKVLMSTDPKIRFSVIWQEDKGKKYIMYQGRYDEYDRAAAQKESQEIYTKNLKENPFWKDSKIEFTDSTTAKK